MGVIRCKLSATLLVVICLVCAQFLNSVNGVRVQTKRVKGKCFILFIFK